MNLQRKLRLGPVVCILALTGWIGAPLQAQQAAPEPEAAAPATAFPEGPLPPHVAEQVRAIVRAMVKAHLPPAEEGSVELDRIDKGTVLSVTVGGQKYSGNVFRAFMVEPLNPNEIDAMKEYYVRTTLAPWPLKDGVVIPTDICLSGMAERVSAYDKDGIAAQEAAIARTDALCKKALDRVEPQRKAKTAAVSEAHKADMDALTKRITELTAEIAKKEADRNQVITRVNRSIPNQPAQQNQQYPPGNLYVVPPSQPNQPNQTPRVTSGRDGNGNLLWEWNAGTVTFYDNLDQSKQELDDTYAAQKKLQATIDSEVSAAVGQRGTKERVLRAILQGHHRRILGGETISDEDMRADYEAALGESLSAPPASGKPPIQAVPAQKKGT